MKKHARLPISGILFRSFLLFTLLAGALFSVISPSQAAFVNNIELSKPDVSSYPDLVLQFRMIDSDGAFVKNLDINSVHVIENEQVISPDSLELQEPGLRLVVAVNEGPTLANRYGGVSRFDKIKEALTTWADSKTITTMDDFSIVSNTGIITSNLSKPADWIDALSIYQPELRGATPALTSLSTALDLASADSVSNKTPAVLYITPLPTEDQNVGLDDLISRAKLSGVRLIILLVGPQTYATEDQTSILRRAANSTGGELYIFSGQEDPPDFSLIFDPLTYIYTATYTSRIMNAGDHALSLKINRGESLFESDRVVFTLNVADPNPIFISPPAKVERSWTETDQKKDSVLTPDTFPLEIMIEFPDGLERDLLYSRLFVDNKLADENTEAPFDKFEWDISGLTESGTHIISASIEDSAGFIVETVELPVEVVIQPKPQTWVGKLFSAFSVQSITLFIIITIAGVILVLMAVRSLKQNRTATLNRMRKLEDPLTQPVYIENEVIHPRSKDATSDEWPHIPGSGLAPARLLLQSTDAKAADMPLEIALGDGVFTIGSDPKKAKIILPSPLVSGLHARITKDDENQYKIQDEGSGTGTWLNYAPVSQYGARLLHGDLIQFGTISYRFEIYESQPARFVEEPLEDE